MIYTSTMSDIPLATHNPLGWSHRVWAIPLAHRARFFHNTTKQPAQAESAEWFPLYAPHTEMVHTVNSLHYEQSVNSFTFSTRSN